MAMSILDIAFWDIACRALNVPLWKLLGGHKDKARMYLNMISADASRGALINDQGDIKLDYRPEDKDYISKGGVFPVIPEATLRASLGILARTVE